MLCESGLFTARASWKGTGCSESTSESLGSTHALLCLSVVRIGAVGAAGFYSSCFLPTKPRLPERWQLPLLGYLGLTLRSAKLTLPACRTASNSRPGSSGTMLTTPAHNG